MELLEINYNMEILDIIKNCKGIVLWEMRHIAPELINYNFEDMFSKIEKVIMYYKALIEKIEEYRHEDLLEFDFDEHGNVVNREEIQIKIEERFNLFLVTKNEQNFREFFDNWGLLVNENGTIEEMIQNAKDVILFLIPNYLYDLYKECANITLIEKNIFILWHLIGFARSLIRSFIIFHNQNKYYDNLLIERSNINQTIPREKISIFGYIKDYDFLEVNANYYTKKLEDMQVFYESEVDFKYNNSRFTRYQVVMSLQEAESEEYIIYPATFYPFQGIETNGNEYFKFILYLYYRHNELPQEELLSTREDCISVINNRALPNQNFETNILVTPFYVFYYSIFSFKLQQKLEQNIINNYFINEIVHKNESQREYLPENIIKPFKLATGKDVPPQIHYGLVNYIYNICSSQYDQLRGIQHGGQQQHSSGSQYGGQSSSQGGGQHEVGRGSRGGRRARGRH
uniref:Uncharacterized protein n=1 Tax=Meloidogyne floridensis TaxID=298350 RepID=A0A915P4G2_9BILA